MQTAHKKLCAGAFLLRQTIIGEHMFIFRYIYIKWTELKDLWRYSSDGQFGTMYDKEEKPPVEDEKIK
jgi:hypothetical protein